MRAAQSARTRKPDSFFIDEILRLRPDGSKATQTADGEDVVGTGLPLFITRSQFSVTLLSSDLSSVSSSRRIQMPRKGSPSRRSLAVLESTQIGNDSGSARPRDSGKNPAARPDVAGKAAASLDELTRLALKGCLIARDAAFNVRDLLSCSSLMAFLGIKDCDKELDLIERQID